MGVAQPAPSPTKLPSSADSRRPINATQGRSYTITIVQRLPTYTYLPRDAVYRLVHDNMMWVNPSLPAEQVHDLSTSAVVPRSFSQELSQPASLSIDNNIVKYL